MSMSAEFFKNLNQSIRINWSQLPQEYEQKSGQNSDRIVSQILDEKTDELGKTTITILQYL